MSVELKILERTKEIVERGWTQGESARSAIGVKVAIDDIRACQWCVSGAMSLACKEVTGTPLGKYWEAYGVLKNVLPNPVSGLVRFNDHPGTKKQDVLNVLDKAIAKEKAAQLDLSNLEIKITETPLAFPTYPPAEKSLEQWLEDVDVLPPGMWDNTEGPVGWHAVMTESDGGIIAYFSNEVDAYRFRLDYINRKLNP
jgi:hypothetical protein